MRSALTKKFPILHNRNVSLFLFMPKDFKEKAGLKDFLKKILNNYKIIIFITKSCSIKKHEIRMIAYEKMSEKLSLINAQIFKNIYIFPIK